MSDFPAHEVTRLRHMLDAATKIEQFLDGHERADLETDEMLALKNLDVARAKILHWTVAKSGNFSPTRFRRAAVSRAE